MNKITDIHSIEFTAGPITVGVGDKLTVVHTLTEDSTGRVVEKRKLSQHDFDQETTFTRSIMFKLNGQWNHIIGTQETVDWLRSL